MDADLIRLILLILGVGLIAGIWVWDRWQRSHGGPPMVRRREPEHEDEALPLDDEPAADDRDDEPEPEPEIVAWDSEPDPVPEIDAEPDSEPTPELEPEREPHLFADRDEPEPADDQPLAEPEPAPEHLPSLSRKPAWVQPHEPVIPAFLIAADRDSDSTFEPESEPEAEAEAEAEAEQPPAADLHAPAAEARPQVSPQPRPAPAQPRPAARTEPSLTATRDDEPEIPVLELAPEPIDAPARGTRAKPKEPDAKAKSKPATEPVTIRADDDQFDLDLGFSAMDDQDLQDVAMDLPDLIVQINIVARGEPFTGEQVLAAMDQVEMRPGEHDIFHRYDNRAARGQKPKSLFSLASLVEPGNFPLKKMRDFSTPGLTLFTQLPGPRDGLLIYSDMLYVAERLARLLDARLKDDNRSTLTKQTIEHTRERIAEHKRQITLRLRQAGDAHKGRR